MPQSLFDHNPDNYDRARPAYPPALFERLVEYLGPRAHGVDAIEVGPGTGQATATLLARGMRVTAVELGARLAAFLARKFAAEPGLKVIHGPFEDVPAEDGSADLVLAATSWHWIDPSRRIERAHALLRPGGVLAVIDTVQVRDPVDRGFFDRTYPIYQQYRPGERRDPGRDPETYEPPAYAELKNSGRFSDSRLWRARWDQAYGASSYEALLRSYSDIARMPAGPREGLIRALVEVVKGEPEGRVIRPLVMTLVAGRRT